MSKPDKQIHLAAHFLEGNNTAIWGGPAASGHIRFSSFAHLARTGEPAESDFLFLTEGLREHNGLIYDRHAVGRPEPSPCFRRWP